MFLNLHTFPYISLSVSECSSFLLHKAQYWGNLTLVGIPTDESRQVRNNYLESRNSSVLISLHHMDEKGLEKLNQEPLKILIK